MTTRDPLDYGWWLASRSSGIVAYLLLSAAVIAGLAMALRIGPVRALRTTHERMALLALGAVAAHGLLLLPDPWLRPGLSGVLVPFASDYRPVWTGLGILAAYLAAALALTFYVRGRIGARRWRTAHRLIPIAWVMTAVHVIGAGSDAGSLWLQAPIALTAALVLTLLGRRLLPRPAIGAGPAARAPGRARARPGGGAAVERLRRAAAVVDPGVGSSDGRHRQRSARALDHGGHQRPRLGARARVLRAHGDRALPGPHVHGPR